MQKLLKLRELCPRFPKYMIGLCAFKPFAMQVGSLTDWLIAAYFIAYSPAIYDSQQVAIPVSTIYCRTAMQTAAFHVAC